MVNVIVIVLIEITNASALINVIIVVLMDRQWEQRMATLRALNRRRATVPYEFHCNGGDAEQRKAQDLKVGEGACLYVLYVLGAAKMFWGMLVCTVCIGAAKMNKKS